MPFGTILQKGIYSYLVQWDFISVSWIF